MNATQKKIIRMYQVVRVPPTAAFIAQKMGISREYTAKTIREWLATKKPATKQI